MEVIETYKREFIFYLNEKIKVKEPVNLYEPIHYILQIGGKKLRPILTLLTCEIFGGKREAALDAALSIEVFHNFTLIHDDIMDAAPIRRGNETVHKKWNVNTGILSGDAMMIMAYQCLESYPPELFKNLMFTFNKAALEVCEGQQLDVDFETRNDVTIGEYIKMITFKTSVLVASAMKMGALIAGVSESELEKIYLFGLNLGIAFQLQDDYLDTFGNSADFGKAIGGDITENKKTFLYLKTLEIANDNDKENLVSLYNSNLNSNEKIAEVTSIFRKNNIAEITSQEIENYTKLSFEALDKLEITEDKKDLLRNFGLQLMRRTI